MTSFEDMKRHAHRTLLRTMTAGTTSNRRDLFGPPRFVWLEVKCGEPVGCWGLLWDDLMEFVPLWTRNAEDWDAVIHEIGSTESCGLMDTEVKTAIDGEHEDAATTPEAWAALAHYRLTGERLKVC